MLRNLFPIAGWRGAKPPVQRRHGVKGFDRVRTPHLSLAMSAIAFWLAINTPTRSTALADSEGPHVTTVEIVSSPAVGDTYGLSECIDIALTFDTKVRVLGSPAIGIWVGTPWYGAAYRTGSGTNKLIFSHRVQWEDVDNDGISVFPGQASRADGASDGLTRGFARGSIVAGDTGAGAHPEFAGIHAAAGHKVDWNNVVQVAGVSIISRPAVGDTYRAGEALQVQLSYAEDIVVEGPVGVSIYVGDEGSSWRGAWYVRGSGTDTLVFRYVVKRTDVDANGLSVSSGWRGSGYIGVGGIRSAATGQYSSRSYPGIRNADDHKVLGSEALVAPRITSLSVATRPAAVDYGAGDRIAVEVAFDEPVLVTGSPELELDFDGTPRTAD